MKEPKQDSAARRVARSRVIQVAVFMFVFYILSAMTLMIPLRPTHSEEEKRDLTKFPEFSIAALADGSFFDGVNKWFADTFPFRDKWIAASDTIKGWYGSAPQDMQVFGEVETAETVPSVNRTTTQPVMTFPTSPAPPVGQTGTSKPQGETVVTQPTNPNMKPAGQNGDAAEQFGAVAVVGDSGFEYYNFMQDVADDYIALVNKAGTQLDGIATVYDIIVPTSMDICVKPSIREGLSSSVQKDAIDYFYAHMNDKVKVVDIYDTLVTAHNNGEYLYFRTDHHWTALGAYRAYEQFCNIRQRAPTPLSAFELQEFDGYLGTFYSNTKVSAMKDNPDVVQAFVPPSTNTMSVTLKGGTVIDVPVVMDVSGYPSSLKYNTFIYSDNPYSVIKNPNLHDGSACVLIKESFGNAFAPFLVEDYETVYIIDYRYFSSVNDSTLKEFVVEHGVQDVLFLNNISATRAAVRIDELEDLVG